jgi:transcriptional regulator with XRE-family HTH domain
MKTTQYLDSAKKALGIESDYALAPHLGLTRSGVSKLRREVVVMSNTTAARIAEILGVDEIKVIADLELERGSNDELWRKIARRVAVLAVAALGAIAAPSPAEAAAGGAHSAACPGCVLCKVRRRRPLGFALLEFVRRLAFVSL